ncbi:hypothetical protein BDF20DRAFT_913426 [Mycotypha africana]|uniref:uncharacterized protein n=1 Tax=Mycotypha africana TaxID=64632 RepID=UPI0023019534|nr:uncharacterized protein BDF20DRAFT_913426 [Mycotypha africana]KAI8977048.1 hypothetical protein BDF20DRAFT_913426 [Mycotypha africana]
MASSLMHTQHPLPPDLNFSDGFWDDHNKGVDIIMSRLRKSRETCEEIRKIYELRANIEQDYGERLLKLAQNSRIGEFEENTFAETLSRIPSALETTARAHIDLAQQLKDHLEAPLDGFVRDQKDLRRAQQQQIEKSKQFRSLYQADVLRAKECYSSECNKLIALEQYLSDIKSNTRPASADEILRIEKEIEEQKKMVAVADQVYKRSIDNYNAGNETWVNDWTNVANICQEMEVKRISYLRSTLWSFANMMTSTFSIDEECCDRIRTALEITDVQKDIQTFVQRYGTGNRIPGPLSYGQLYQLPLNSESSTSLLQATSHHHTNNESNKSLTVPNPRQTSSLDSLHDTNNPINITNGSRSASDSFILPKTQPLVTTILTNPDEELKSIDRQLQQLEIQHNPQQQHATSGACGTDKEQDIHENNHLATSPQQISVNGDASNNDANSKKNSKVDDDVKIDERQQSTLTDQSNGLVSTAFKEVEKMLNHNNSTSSAVPVSPAEAIEAPTREQHCNPPGPSTAAEKGQQEIGSSSGRQPSLSALQQAMQSGDSRPISIADDFSSGIYNALGIKDDRTSQYDQVKAEGKEKSPSVAHQSKPSAITTTAAGGATINFEIPIAAKLDSSLSHDKAPSITSNGGRSQKYAPTPNPAYLAHNKQKEGNQLTEGETTAVAESSTQQITTNRQETSPDQHSGDKGQPKPELSDDSNILSNIPIIKKLDENSLKENEDEDEEDDDDAEYQRCHMPRLPPKDEKWVISSIRRPQQLPVRSINATVFDGTAASARNNMTSLANSVPMSKNISQQHQDGEQQQQQHQPKPHRPIVPLTIEIPNSVVGSNVQNTAQQVMQEGRKYPQMSPVQKNLYASSPTQQQQHSLMKHGSNGYINQQHDSMEADNGGIRPAPWHDEYTVDPMTMNNMTAAAAASGFGALDSYQQQQPPLANNFHTNSTMNGLPAQQQMQLRPDLMLGPRASSLKLTEQELQLQQQQHQQQLSQLRHSYQIDDGTVEPDRKAYTNGAIATAAGGGNKPAKQSKQKEKESSGIKTGRFSLGFFGGNKKDKKKEKEKKEATTDQYHQQLQRPMSHQQQQFYQNGPRELSQNDVRSSFSGSGHGNVMQAGQQTFGVPQQQSTMPSTPSNNGNNVINSRFIGFAKAQWPFQASIDGEMSIDTEEIVGIIRKQMDGWWEAERIGSVGTGQRGLIPGNYMLDNQPPPQGASIQHT